MAMSGSLYSRPNSGLAHADELRWRYLYADGEVMGIGSTLRSEYVPASSGARGVDGRCIAAARRIGRIDRALGRLSTGLRTALRRVYGERNRLEVFGPAGNLVPLVASPWYRASRSTRAYHDWLHRELSKAQRGTGNQRLIRELGAAADALLAEALAAYGAAR
jgi:hypothetical protein